MSRLVLWLSLHESLDPILEYADRIGGEERVAILESRRIGSSPAEGAAVPSDHLGGVIESVLLELSNLPAPSGVPYSSIGAHRTVELILLARAWEPADRDAAARVAVVADQIARRRLAEFVRTVTIALLPDLLPAEDSLPRDPARRRHAEAHTFQFLREALANYPGVASSTQLRRVVPISRTDASHNALPPLPEAATWIGRMLRTIIAEQSLFVDSVPGNGSSLLWGIKWAALRHDESFEVTYLTGQALVSLGASIQTKLEPVPHAAAGAAVDRFVARHQPEQELDRAIASHEGRPSFGAGTRPSLSPDADGLVEEYARVAREWLGGPWREHVDRLAASLDDVLRVHLLEPLNQQLDAEFSRTWPPDIPVIEAFLSDLMGEPSDWVKGPPPEADHSLECVRLRRLQTLGVLLSRETAAREALDAREAWRSAKIFERLTRENPDLHVMEDTFRDPQEVERLAQCRDDSRRQAGEETALLLDDPSVWRAARERAIADSLTAIRAEESAWQAARDMTNESEFLYEHGLARWRRALAIHILVSVGVIASLFGVMAYLAWEFGLLWSFGIWLVLDHPRLLLALFCLLAASVVLRSGAHHALSVAPHRRALEYWRSETRRRADQVWQGHSQTILRLQACDEARAILRVLRRGSAEIGALLRGVRDFLADLNVQVQARVESLESLALDRARVYPPPLCQSIRTDEARAGIASDPELVAELERRLGQRLTPTEWRSMSLAGDAAPLFGQASAIASDLARSVTSGSLGGEIERMLRRPHDVEHLEQRLRWLQSASAVQVCLGSSDLEPAFAQSVYASGRLSSATREWIEGRLGCPIVTHGEERFALEHLRVEAVDQCAAINLIAPLRESFCAVHPEASSPRIIEQRLPLLRENEHTERLSGQVLLGLVAAAIAGQASLDGTLLTVGPGSGGAFRVSGGGAINVIRELRGTEGELELLLEVLRPYIAGADVAKLLQNIGREGVPLVGEEERRALRSGELSLVH